MSDNKLKKLKDLLELASEGLTRDEFMAAFKAAMDLIMKTETSLAKRIDTKLADTEQAAQDARDAIAQAQSDLERIVQETEDANNTTLASLKKRGLEAIDALFTKLRLETRFNDATNSLVNELRTRIAQLDTLILTVPEVDVEQLAIDAAALIPQQDIPGVTPVEVRDKLESLTGDERLDKTAVKGIEEIEQRVSSIEIRPARVGGAKGIGLYVGGSKKLLTAQTINLVAGTNVTITYAHANGRNDITISASASGGSFSLLTATGTVNDSNVAFTFLSQPSVVVINGGSYRPTGGSITWTWNSGTSTVTLSSPVGNGGDIYAIG